MFYSRLSQVHLNENWESISGTDPGLIPSSLWPEKIKRYIPPPLFFTWLSHCIWTPKVSFSSLLQQKLWQANAWHHKSQKRKMKQGEKLGFLIIPFKMLLPPEFVWCGFLFVSISIRNEEFVTKDICSVTAKLPALQQRLKKYLWDFQEFLWQKAELSLRPIRQREIYLLSFRICPFSAYCCLMWKPFQGIFPNCKLKLASTGFQSLGSMPPLR